MALAESGDRDRVIPADDRHDVVGLTEVVYVLRYDLGAVVIPGDVNVFFVIN
jgi:hypothetical protein